MERYVVGMIRTVGLLIPLLLLVLHTSAEDRLYVIPLDTCSYLVARDISERGMANIAVVHPLEALSLPRGAKVAIIAHIQPMDWLHSFVLSATKEREAEIVIFSDVLKPGGVPSSAIKMYCDSSDERALAEIAKYFVVEQSPPSVLLLGLLAGGVASASLLLSSHMKELGRRLSEIPLALLIALFRRRGRLSESELYDHPMRASIIKALETSPLDFSSLQNKLGVSRASLEWHLATLIAYGVVREERKGRRRVYILSGDSPL